MKNDRKIVGTPMSISQSSVFYTHDLRKNIENQYHQYQIHQDDDSRLAYLFLRLSIAGSYTMIKENHCS